MGKLFASSDVVLHRNANSAACRREVLIEIFKTQPANRDGYLLVVVTEPVVPVGGSDAVEKDVAGQVPGALDVAVPVEEDWAATRVASSGSCSKAVVPVGVFEPDRKFRSGSKPRPASTSIVWSPLRRRTTLRDQSKASDGRNMPFSHSARTAGSTLWANIAVDSDSTPSLTTSAHRV
ncbi:hypothetical protein ASE60_28510 [Ensifer sp. Root278]|nr:hypothetical protein ASE60_28510 [Ensifer sp. Root278]